MRNFIPIISLLSLPLLSLTMCQENNMQNKKQNIQYVKYFHKRTLIPNKNFKHINSRFTNEIKASPNEIILKLKAIENAKGQFYKVFYNKNNQITHYQFFKKDKLISSTNYKYGPKNNLTLNNKITKIEYYNSKGNLIAHDKITYNKFGRPTQTKRYAKNGNATNLF